MRTRPVARDWSFARSVRGIEVLVAYGERHGIAVRDLLAGTGLGLGWTHDRPGEVTAAQELRVVRNLQRLRPGCGAEVGATYRAATFGVLGFALQTSATVAEASQLMLRYLDLSHAFALPRLALTPEEVVLTVDGAAVPADVRALLVARDATAIATVFGELMRGRVHTRVEVGPGRATLRFPIADLAAPIGDGVDRATAQAACRELALRRRDPGPLVGEVRVVIAQQVRDGAPASGVAVALGWSERTLRRRLAAAGTTYQRVLDDVRADLAARLLAPPAGLAVRDVAERLGFADATTFIRAHRRWTGRTPGAAEVPAAARDAIRRPAADPMLRDS